MENFTAFNPVELHFGENVIDKLGRTVRKYGTRVLLVYGGGSIKKNGVYKQVLNKLIEADMVVYEYGGIRPNPIIEDVDAAASLGRLKEVDMVLAVGGGSVIDSAKIISITIPVDHSGWEFMKERECPEKAVPLIGILTLAATGTEMNRFAVVQNNETKEKIGWGHQLTYPKETFLDPAYTLSVPKDYTAFGVVDLIAHCLEAYFGEGEATLSDRFVYSIIQEGMKYGELLLDDLQNYGHREKILYASTCALNNLTMYGRKSGDWGVHSIGHVLSVLYDVPHGASLSIGYPAWMRLMKDRAGDRIREIGAALFGAKDIDETVFSFENLFHTLDSPTRLSDIGIGSDKHEEILQTMIANKVGGMHYGMDEADYRKLIGLMA